MKSSEWKIKYDTQNTDKKIRVINIMDFLDLEFDDQPERLSEKTPKGDAIV